MILNNRQLISELTKETFNVFPCYEREVRSTDEKIFIFLSTNILLHKENEDKKIDIYKIPVKARYEISLDSNQTESVNSYISNFIHECVKFVRFGQVNEQAEKVFENIEPGQEFYDKYY